MKTRKKTVLILLLALLLTAFAVAMAQTPAQGDQKKSEACCSMESCCCSGDSCEMKKHTRRITAPRANAARSRTRQSEAKDARRLKEKLLTGFTGCRTD